MLPVTSRKGKEFVVGGSIDHEPYDSLKPKNHGQNHQSQVFILHTMPKSFNNEDATLLPLIPNNMSRMKT
jgi:hypothetical protein